MRKSSSMLLAAVIGLAASQASAADLPRKAPAYIPPPPLTWTGCYVGVNVGALRGRFELEKAVAFYTARYAVGEVPRPSHWSGFRIMPQEIEFWRDGAFRLHERVRFTSVANGGWAREWLYP